MGDTSLHTTYWPDGEPHQTRIAEDGEWPPSHGRGWTGRLGHKLIPAPAVTYVGHVSLPAMLTTLIYPLPADAGSLTLPEVVPERSGDATSWRLPTSDGSISVRTAHDRFEVDE